MVVIVTEQPTEGFAGTGVIASTMDFFRTNWKIMFVCLIFVVLFIIIWYLFKKIEEERHEREEPGYQLFKTVKASCILNKNPDLISRKWSPKSLFLLFIPVVGWMLIPFIKSEHSARLIDYNGKLIGYYRGEYKGMDSTRNFLVYQKKTFFFFEDTFIVKVPTKLKMKVKERDKKTGILKLDGNKKPILIDKTINLVDMCVTLPNKDIKLYSVSLEKVGIYYYCPVFLTDKGDGILDYREIVEGAVIDNTYQIMVQRLLNTASQAMEKGMLLNPNLKYDQMKPEKTVEEQKLDKDVNQQG